MPSTQDETTGERSGAGSWLAIAARSPLLLVAGLFVSQLAALWAYRLDYPINDDWRYYRFRTRLPDDLTLEWLILPARDTLHISGKLLDWLFFRFVAHDYHHIAAASFALCFGGWLICAVALCLMLAKRRRSVTFAGLLALALPLAAMPYWVTASDRQWLEPMIAYHQMLPVLGLFLLALLCAVDRSRWPRGLDVGIAASSTLFFALTYSSGALVLVAFGAAVALFSMLALRVGVEQLRQALPLGIAIVAVGGLCLVAHVVAPILQYKINPIFETRAYGATYPWSAKFWIFFFALFDRAVLSTATDAAAAIRGAAVAALVVAPAIGLTILVARRRLDARRSGFAMILVSVTVAVVAYVALVSYGRASFGNYYLLDKIPPDPRASLYAHHRFFYWWITAILPLTTIAWGLLVEAVASRRAAALVSIAVALLLLLPKAQVPADSGAYLRHWDFPALYRRDAEELAAVRTRDLARSLGQEAISPRRVQWNLLPKAKQNPWYRHGRDETYAKRKPLYRRARRVGARFMEAYPPPAPTPPHSPKRSKKTASP